MRIKRNVCDNHISEKIFMSPSNFLCRFCLHANHLQYTYNTPTIRILTDEVLEQKRSCFKCIKKRIINNTTHFPYNNKMWMLSVRLFHGKYATIISRMWMTPSFFLVSLTLIVTIQNVFFTDYLFTPRSSLTNVPRNAPKKRSKTHKISVLGIHYTL